MDLLVDCEDLYKALTQAAVGSQTDQQMAIYLSALRHDVATGRLRNRYWIPTDYMVANYGTKLNEDGTVPLGNTPITMVSGTYHIPVQYGYKGKQKT